MLIKWLHNRKIEQRSEDKEKNVDFFNPRD